MTAYYNDIDPSAAAWLRELIKAGHIAHGIVDERSIEDVFPDDLRGFTQCHFFAGIGVWSYALRQAGWPDDRPVWTGSCPCQPFSAAGKGAGFADERHLWPAFHHLIRQFRPATVLGEQVASKDGLVWFDLVQADMEGEGYACAAVDTCAAGFGAPHIRQRLYWVADTQRTGVRTRGRSQDAGTPGGLQRTNGEWQRVRPDIGKLRGLCGVEYAGHHHDAGEVAPPGDGQPQTNRPADQPSGSSPPSCGLGQSNGNGCEPWRAASAPVGHGDTAGANGGLGRTSPTNGHWAGADWLLCRDGKWRPVESGTFPLADGAAARVVRLRGYGNAIVAPQAQAFIEAVIQTD